MSTIVGYSVMAVLMLVLVQRRFQIRWSYESLGALVVGASVAIALGLLPNWSGILGLAGRVVIAVGFAVACMLIARRQQLAANVAWKKAGGDAV